MLNLNCCFTKAHQTKVYTDVFQLTGYGLENDKLQMIQIRNHTLLNNISRQILKMGGQQLKKTFKPMQKQLKFLNTVKSQKVKTVNVAK